VEIPIQKLMPDERAVDSSPSGQSLSKSAENAKIKSGESRYEVALARLVVVAVVVKALGTAQTKVVVVVYLVTPIPPVILGVSLCAVVRAVVMHIKYIYSFSTLVA
jgi:hypothetical protein